MFINKHYYSFERICSLCELHCLSPPHNLDSSPARTEGEFCANQPPEAQQQHIHVRAAPFFLPIKQSRGMQRRARVTTAHLIDSCAGATPIGASINPVMIYGVAGPSSGLTPRSFRNIY
ncbi:hypothetical protein CDAR_378851 [Caerostris darwini]|uniref:Uncharacterized protein n=1 Tax=Caerostris darwini TaxID=1538125 RepID=A0AAV4TWM3_9ARAC|nr:hypothetical protein CDAR_378851 [Caerostris darwini]